MGYDDFPLDQRQRRQRGGGRLSIERGMVGGDKPGRSLGGGTGLVTLTALGGSPRTNGPVADDAIEPCHRMFRRLGLRGELQKRFLDDIFRDGTPLPRVQHQRRRVCVDQTAQEFRSHRYHDAGRGLSSHFWLKADN